MILDVAYLLPTAFLLGIMGQMWGQVPHCWGCENYLDYDSVSHKQTMQEGLIHTMQHDTVQRDGQWSNLLVGFCVEQQGQVRVCKTHQSCCLEFQVPPEEAPIKTDRFEIPIQLHEQLGHKQQTWLSRQQNCCRWGLRDNGSTEEKTGSAEIASDFIVSRSNSSKLKEDSETWWVS